MRKKLLKIIAIPENNAKNAAPQSVNYCVIDFRRTPVRLQICSLQFALCSTAFFALFSGLAIIFRYEQCDKIHRGSDGVVRVFGLTKTVCGMDKRDSGLACRLVVAVGIADIDRVLQMVLFDDCTDVVCLCLSGIARAEMAFEIVTEACGFQKNFDIARLAVAYDIKRVMSGKNRKCIGKSRINRSRCSKKCLMLFGAAGFDQF